MKRANATISLVVGAMLFAPSAQACISCEHVPVVVRGAQTQDVTPRYYAPKPSYVRPRTTTKAKSRARAQHRATLAARKKAKAKATARAKATAVRRSVAHIVPPLPVRVQAGPSRVGTVEDKFSTLADAKTDFAAKQETVATLAGGAQQVAQKICSRYVPSAGLTITVSCE